MNNQKTTIIFELKANAGVMQDKSGHVRNRLADNQPYRAADQIRSNNYLEQSAQGSKQGRAIAGTPPQPLVNRQRSVQALPDSRCDPLEPLTTQIPRSVKSRIMHLARQEEMSASATAAAFLGKAVQADADMEYGAMLRPVIEDSINKTIRKETNRTANLSLEALHSSEETRIYVIYMIRLLLGSEDMEILPQIIKDVQQQARENVERILSGEYDKQN